MPKLYGNFGIVASFGGKNIGPEGVYSNSLRTAIKKRTDEWMESPLAGKAVTDAFDLLVK